MKNNITLNKYIALQIKVELARHKGKKASYSYKIMKIADDLRLTKKENVRLYKQGKKQKGIDNLTSKMCLLIEAKNGYIEKEYINQKVLAEKTGIGESHISEICKGQVNLHLSTIQKIQEVLGIQFDLNPDNIKSINKS